MKKVYLILTLFVTSLFFFSINTVSADTIYEVGSDNLDFINDDFYMFRDYIINYSNENNKFYIIGYSGSFYAYLFNDDTLNVENTQSGLLISKNLVKKYFYLTSDGTITSPVINSMANYFLKGSTGYKPFIDTNMKNVHYVGTDPVVIKYNDLSYTIKNNDSVPSFYQIYLDSTVPEEPEEPPIVENETLSNFYFTTIEKIDFLATAILSDYIYLTVIGIFLLIFIIKLILGRYL